jgi:hypothetical protein
MNAKLSRIAPNSKSGASRLRRNGCDCVRSGSHQNFEDAVRVTPLRGVLDRIGADLRQVALTLEGLRSELASIAGAADPGQLPMALILDAVCAHFNVARLKVLAPKGRRACHVWPRMVAMYLGRHLAQLTFFDLGEMFFRDGGTAMHAVKAVENRMETEPLFRAEIEALKARLIPPEKDETGGHHAPGLKTKSAHRYDDERRLSQHQ